MDLTWDDIRGAVGALAQEQDEWTGLPLPIHGCRLRLHPRHHRFAQLDGAQIDRTEETPERACAIDETLQERRRWYSRRLRAEVVLYTEGGSPRVKHVVLPREPFTRRLELTLQTFEPAMTAWDLNAEFAAMTKLMSLVPEHIFRYYMLTGAFPETSKRSHVTYLFRRLRPTLALRASDEHGTRVLAALCLHSLAWYEGTWGGAMVPTDDVISHLLYMRGDEKKFWRYANQHPPWAAEAGI